MHILCKHNKIFWIFFYNCFIFKECGHKCHNKQVCRHLCCKSKALQNSISGQASLSSRDVTDDGSERGKAYQGEYGTRRLPTLSLRNPNQANKPTLHKPTVHKPTVHKPTTVHKPNNPSEQDVPSSQPLLTLSRKLGKVSATITQFVVSHGKIVVSDVKSKDLMLN